MLQGTRLGTSPLRELRHHDERHPLRVLYRSTALGPEVVAIIAKQDNRHGARLIARVSGWVR